MHDATAAIVLRGVGKTFDTPLGPYVAVGGVDLAVEPGEFVAVVGKSGSGKSTLLNLVAGIDRPSAGEVVVARQCLNDMSEDALARWRGRNVGVVFQFFQLLPTLTSVENVMLPMDLRRAVPSRDRRERALALLDLLTISDQADKLPHSLSGGQQQRVAIARALANDPPILVADEPTGNVDAMTAETVLTTFQRLATGGKTIVMVTHERDIVRWVDRVVKIQDGIVVADEPGNRMRVER